MYNDSRFINIYIKIILLSRPRLRYQVYPFEALSWSEARAFCRSEGGTLARANSGNQWLQMVAAANNVSVVQAWVDGKREGGEDKFLCASNPKRRGFPCRFLPWAFSQPSAAGGEACVVVLRGTFTYVTFEQSCTAQLGVMCHFRVDHVGRRHANGDMNNEVTFS